MSDEAPRPVISCCHVEAGAPVRYVFHDADGDWQFLCGFDDHTEEDAVVLTLDELLDLDDTLAEVLEMPPQHGASRELESDPWTIEDEGAEWVHRCIAEDGFAIDCVEARKIDGAELPSVCHTIGLTETHGQAELLVLGLPVETAEEILQLCADRIAAGERFGAGDEVDEVIAGGPVRMQAVTRPEERAALAAVAQAYYKEQPFELLQIVFPDTES